MTAQINPQPPLLPAPRQPVPSAPIHPLAALTTIVLDNLFTLPEVAGPEVWIFSIPIIGGVAMVATTLVQRYLSKDSWGEAVAKGVVMGVIAGVPLSITGTAVGGILLGWAGLHELIRLPAPRVPQTQLPTSDTPSENILEGEARDVK